jgi:hypothetical protein
MRPRWVRSEGGFVLPLVVGVGAVLMLLGTMMIIRASQNDRTAIAEKSTSRSLAVTEAGITHFQSFLNQNRLLARMCSTSTPVPCQGAPKNWVNVNYSDIQSQPSFCTSGATPPPPGSIPNPDPSILAQNYAQNFLNGTWQNMSADPNDGQFRLVEYIYDPDPNPAVAPNPDPTGILVVEGRVNQELNGSETYRTAKSRLEAKFRISNGIGGGGEIPGLWISDNGTADASGSAQLQSNVRDSTCPPGNSTRVDKLKTALQLGLLSAPGTTYSYQETPGMPFPALPSKPSPSYLLPSNISISGGGSDLLPRPGDTPSGGVITYQIPAQGGKSIDVSGGSTLTVGSGSETIALVLDGGMTLSGGSRIQITPGSRLVIYANGPIDLSGGSGVNAVQVDSPENAQIYAYTADNVTLSGGSAMKLFLFAPQSQVVFSSDSNVWGTIWARSWKGSGSALMRQWNNLNLAQFPFPDRPRLSPTISWRHCPVDQPSACPL